MLFAYFTPCSSVSIVNFQQVDAHWVGKNVLITAERIRITFPAGIYFLTIETIEQGVK